MSAVTGAQSFSVQADMKVEMKELEKAQLQLLARGKIAQQYLVTIGQ